MLFGNGYEAVYAGETWDLKMQLDTLFILSFISMLSKILQLGTPIQKLSIVLSQPMLVSDWACYWGGATGRKIDK